MFNPTTTFCYKKPLTFNLFPKTPEATQISSTKNGTTAKKFVPTIQEEVTQLTNFKIEKVWTKNFCITAMPEYQNKSYEELRLEDYKMKETSKNIPIQAASFVFKPIEIKEPNRPNFNWPKNEFLICTQKTFPKFPSPVNIQERNIFSDSVDETKKDPQQKLPFDFFKLTNQPAKQPVTNPFVLSAPPAQPPTKSPFIFPNLHDSTQPSINNPFNPSVPKVEKPIAKQNPLSIWDPLTTSKEPSTITPLAPSPTTTATNQPPLQLNPHKPTETFSSLTQTLDSPVKIVMAENSLAANPYGDSPLQTLASSLKYKNDSLEKSTPRFTSRFREKISPREHSCERKTDFFSPRLVGEKITPRSILKKPSVKYGPVEGSLRYLEMKELKNVMEDIRFKKRETDPDEFPSLSSEDQIPSQNSMEKSRSLVEKTCHTIPQVYGLSPAGVTLNNEDYYCEPSLEEMSKMIQDGEVYLPNGLIVGHRTFGNIFWPGPLFLQDIALDEIIIFRHKEVVVYPHEALKPLIGEGLNRPAEITLDGVWHLNKETKEPIKDTVFLTKIGWRDRLERVTLKMGASFKDYRPATGSWVFRVENFGEPVEEIAATN